jgi:hypothetical protein
LYCAKNNVVRLALGLPRVRYPLITYEVFYQFVALLLKNIRQDARNDMIFICGFNYFITGSKA